MYIKELKINRFRSIKELSLDFNKGLNILIGENNAGKTAIIDALRLCLGYGSIRRDIYFSKECDFYINKSDPKDAKNETIFDLHFEIEDDLEPVIYRELLAIDENDKADLQLHLKYYLDEKNKLKYKVWGGTNEGQQISTEILQLINYVHLDALRDAEQFLKPFRDSKLARLYGDTQSHTEAEKQALATEVRTVLKGDKWKDFITKGKEKVNEHLGRTTFLDKKQEIEVTFSGLEFGDILNNLHVQLPFFSEEVLKLDPSNEQKYLSIWQNGLGYNNLIYIATVLGDIKQKKEIEPEAYFSLLIEEPEAHLHPQLQDLFFNYLNELATDKDFQIFVSSHSPTITAKADLNSINVLQHQAGEISALSLRNSDLDEANKKFLHKFLDVTKSQLFFANSVIFVEGISEALLLPVFSRKMGADYDVEKAGCEIVNINGIAFEHFAKLYNSAKPEKGLKNRCSIITDDDRTKDDDDGSPRATKIKAMENNLLKVFVGAVTFEYELFLASDFNRQILLEIYKEFHPKTTITVDADIPTYAKNFAKKVADQQGKSELAHRLSIRLEEDAGALTNFVIPTYIQDAIKYAVKNE